MVSLFKRFYIPAVRLDTVIGSLFNLDGNGITFEWDISRDNTNTVDQGLITIYNLGDATRKLLYESWNIVQAGFGLGYNATFSIGWDGLTEMVFKGNVWDLVPDDRQGGADVRTVLSVGDGNKTLRDQTVGRSFSSVSISIVLDYLVALPPAGTDIGGGGLGLIFTPESKAVIAAAQAELPVQFWNNIPAGANTRETIDVIMATLGLEWRVHNGEFIAMRGGVINRPGLILAPKSGLITYTPRDDGGVVIEALANPNMQPGLQFFVKSDIGRNLAAPVYRCESVHFTGSTDGQSIMVAEGKKVVAL